MESLQSQTIIYEENYNLLIKIFPFLTKLNTIQIPDYKKLQSEGYMDLNFDLLSQNNYFVEFSLSHYYVERGDMIADPDMVIRLFPKQKMIEAISYQDKYIYKQVYHSEGRFNTKYKIELNKFLNIWLNNLLLQGFKAN